MSKFYIIIIALCLIGCKKTEILSSESTNCPFVQDDDTEDGLIDEDERQIMEDCLAARITDLQLLEENLIGSWDLVGHGEGWFPNISEPCSSLEITEDELILTFQNTWIDTTSVHSWSFVDGFGGNLKLELTPVGAVGLSFDVLCENYMYFDHTPLDGNMYLYKRK